MNYNLLLQPTTTTVAGNPDQDTWLADWQDVTWMVEETNE